MSEQKYDVLDAEGNAIAKDLSIDIALLLVGAYFEKYWAEARACGMKLTVSTRAEAGDD